MKITAKSILVSLILFTLILPGCGKKEDPKNNAALVNGTPVTRKELANEMTRIKERFYTNSKMNDEQISQIEGEILEILIGGELLYQAGKKKGLKIADTLITEELEKTKEKFPDTDHFKNTFTAAEIDRKLMIEKYITTEFADKITITTEQAHKFYQDNLDDFTRPEQILASHILIKIPEDADQSVKKKARTRIKMVQDKLKKGADFAELAKEYSEDSSSVSGGALGYFMRGQMVDAFEKAAFAMEIDQISDIVETKHGLHIIKVMDKKPTYVVPFEDIEEKLKSFIKQQEVQARIDNFIKTERKQADIKIYLESWKNKKG